MRCIFVFDTCMVIDWNIEVAVKWVFFLPVCAVMWGLHVDYIIRLHDQKGHVASRIDHLDRRNAWLH